MKIMYADESDYGQQILQIMGELALLMDEDKLYTKTEICKILTKVKNFAYNLKDKVQWTPATEDFYNPFNTIEHWHSHMKFLEEQAKAGAKQ